MATAWKSVGTTAHRLRTTHSPAQKAVVIVVRKPLRLPLYDRLVVVSEFIHDGMSRSALHRLRVRRGLLRQPVEACQKPAHKTFRTYEPGFVHVDVKYLPQIPDDTARRYLSRGDQSRHPLVVRRHPARHERGLRAGLSEWPARGRPISC